MTTSAQFTHTCPTLLDNLGVFLAGLLLACCWSLAVTGVFSTKSYSDLSVELACGAVAAAAGGGEGGGDCGVDALALFLGGGGGDDHT